MANKVTLLAERAPAQALEALNRLTGLQWASLPRSLVNEVTPSQRVFLGSGVVPVRLAVRTSRL